jgi:ribosomal protein L27
MDEKLRFNIQRRIKMKVYCPIQKIKSKTIVRHLGQNNQTLVSVNDYVTPSDIIGEKKPSAGFHIVNVGLLLRVPSDKAANYIIRKEGERIYKGELIAEKKKMLSSDAQHIFATVDGMIQQINKTTGQIMIKIIKKQEYVPAGLWGKVSKIDTGNIYIDAPVLQVNGKAGRGFEREGTIKILENRHEVIREYSIKEEHSGKIIVGGSLLTREAITRAVSLGVIGFITGGINYQDILLINQNSDIGLTIITMEGYGSIQINENIYKELDQYNNFFAFIDGKEKTLSIPLEKVETETIVTETDKVLRVSSNVRISSDESIGNTGQVQEMISQYQFPSGLITSAVKIIIRNKEYIVPQSNVEILV